MHKQSVGVLFFNNAVRTFAVATTSLSSVLDVGDAHPLQHSTRASSLDITVKHFDGTLTGVSTFTWARGDAMFCSQKQHSVEPGVHVER
eukprot:COSAG03_NODE_82_length_13990_cov_63.581744_3_plen_89_part_00